MKIREFLYKNSLSLVIIVLFIVAILQRATDKTFIPSTPIVKYDTSWIVVRDTAYTKPIFIKGERDTILERSVEYIPSDDYAQLAQQFQDLKEELLSKNYFKDTLKIDSLGYVAVNDTLQKNQIKGRSFNYNLKYPEVTITKIIPEKKKNQIYVGGILQGNQNTLLTNVSAGLLLKNKKDQIYGIQTGLNRSGNLEFGVSSYWKIKLKR